MGKKSKTKSCREDSRVVQIGVWIALSVFTLFILCSPLIFTQPYLFDWDFFDFSRTGDIGDTIGGITAPFIGLLSVILLALTLLEQVRINREQKRFNDTPGSWLFYRIFNKWIAR